MSLPNDGFTFLGPPISQESNVAAKKVAFLPCLFLFLIVFSVVEYLFKFLLLLNILKNNVYQLQRIHFKVTNFCNFLPDIWGALPNKGHIYHSSIFRGLRICISVAYIGLINLFQKNQRVFHFLFMYFLCWISLILFILFCCPWKVVGHA